MAHTDDELVFSTAYLNEIMIDEEKKIRGLKKGATAVILGVIAIGLAQHPLSIDALPKALVLAKMIIIPESFILVFLLAIASLITGVLGFYYSIIKFNLRGFFLSAMILLSFIGLSVNINDMSKNMPSTFKINDLTKIITIEDRDKIKNKINM